MQGEPTIIDVNGVRLFTKVCGAGPRLLFIGGTGWDLRSPNAPLNSELTKHFSVAQFDQRGMGRSDKPDGPYTMKGYASDAAHVLAALGWDKAHVVGYSFGGMVAQELAIGWPERIDKLIIAAATSGGKGGGSYPVHDLLGLPPYDRAKRGLEIADKRFSTAFRNANPEAAEAMIQRRMANQVKYAHEDRAAIGLKEQLAARAQHDCYDRLNRIAAPTLVLAGAQDGQAPQDAQKNLAHAIPNATFKNTSGAHDFLFEDNQGYREICDFLLAEG